MKKPKRIAGIAAASVIVLSVFGISYSYASSIGAYDSSYVSEETISIEYPDANVEQLEDYDLNIYEFEIPESNVKAKNSKGNIGHVNKYGTFSLVTENDKIKKYKYGDTDLSEKYLVKGTADFSKKDVTFDGYFLVNNTLKGNRKGQLTMYKGKLTLPNGDKFDGYLSSGKYYFSGTYTWKNGQSYKGKFTTSNKIGTSTLGDNETSEYGTFYYDSSKKTYLFIRFVNGVPRESGYYKSDSKKYLVTFDENGMCTYTSVVAK